MPPPSKRSKAGKRNNEVRNRATQCDPSIPGLPVDQKCSMLQEIIGSELYNIREDLQHGKLIRPPEISNDVDGEDLHYNLQSRHPLLRAMGQALGGFDCSEDDLQSFIGSCIKLMQNQFAGNFVVDGTEATSLVLKPEELKLLFEEEAVRDKTEQENKAECSVGDTFVVASHEHKTGEDSVLEEIKLEIEPDECCYQEDDEERPEEEEEGPKDVPDIKINDDNYIIKIEHDESTKMKSIAANRNPGKSTTSHECEECGELCYSVVDLHTHMKTHDTDLQCEFCVQVLTNANNVRKHYIRMHAEKWAILDAERSYTCDQCGKAWATQLLLDSHLKVHQRKILKIHVLEAEFTGKCPKCLKDVISAKALQTHLKSCSLKCYICDKVCDNREDLNEHKAAHNIGLQCEMCSKPMANVTALKNHILRKHTEKKFKCDECEMKFASEKFLQLHNRLHEKEREEIKCDRCGWEASGVEARLKFKVHIKTHSEFRCWPCYKGFKSQEDMDKHVANHQINTCQECDVTFVNIHSFRKHMRSAKHGGPRNFQCDKCEKSYITNEKLRNHYISTHTNDRKFDCTVCGKKFFTKAKLEQHIRIHTGERPYECDICHRRFTQSGDKSRHMRTHK